METQNKNFLPVAFQYGIILGVLRILVDFGLKMADVSAMTYYVGYVIGFVLEIVLIFMAIKYFRDKVNGGLLSFSEAIKIGIVMMIITGVFLFISMSFIDQDFQMRKAIEMTEQYNPDQLEETIEKIEEGKKNPKYFMSFGIFTIYFIFIGFVISAIGGAIFGKKEQY